MSIFYELRKIEIEKVGDFLREVVGVRARLDIT